MQAYSIRREINSCSVRLQVEYSTDERWILVRESIMFLSSPSASLDVVIDEISVLQVVSRAILLNLLYWTIMVWIIPRKLS
jgi:hypothetical protein